MYHNHIFNNVNDALPNLMREVLGGDEVGSRGGSRTLELTHVGTTLLYPWRREILNPVRKANIAAQIAETMWVLSGRDDVEWLSNYLPRAGDFSDDGKVWRGAYGPRLRKWGIEREGVYAVDQLAEVLALLRKDRTSRRAVMSIFDPAVDYQDSKDIPCNNWLSFTSRLGKLDLHVAVRSNDLMWGWSGINTFEWSALQEIVAGMLGIGVGGLHFSTTSLHLYDRHWKKATELSHTLTYPHGASDSPRFDGTAVDRDLEKFDDLVKTWFDIEQGIRQGSEHSTRFIENFPEPMLRSWLRVIQWWWTGDAKALVPLIGTRLAMATEVSIQPPDRAQTVLEFKDDGSAVFHGKIDTGTLHTGTFRTEPSKFLQEAILLHTEKDKAYGDSWKRRGEMLGIMANIARKVDRLGQNGAGETAADTALDLMVYLAKYRWWLVDEGVAPDPRQVPYVIFNQPFSDGVDPANELLRQTEYWQPDFEKILHFPPELEKTLTASFDTLEGIIQRGEPDRHIIVDGMLEDAYTLARTLWQREAWKAANATRSWNPEAGQDA